MWIIVDVIFPLRDRTAPILGVYKRKEIGLGGTMKQMVPLYVYPLGKGLKAYEEVGNGQSDGDLIIVNPDSGKGAYDVPNEDWVQGLELLKTRRKVGYVADSYAKKDLDTVLENISKYYEREWAVEGIFLDETQVPEGGVRKQDLLERYGKVYQAVKSRNGVLVLNPGIFAPEEYMDICDIVVMYEENYPNKGYGTTFRPPTFMKKYGPDRFCVMLGNVRSETTARAVVLQAQEYGFGYIYLRDPSRSVYDTLSPYYHAISTGDWSMAKPKCALS